MEEEMELWLLYLILMVGSWGLFAAIWAFISLVVSLGALMMASMEHTDADKALFFKFGRWAFTLSLVLLPFALFLPSNKTVMYMVGGYVATNVEGISDLPPNLVGAANKFLEDYTTK